MVITDFQDLDKVENAGINWGSTAPRRPRAWSRTSSCGATASAVMADTEHPDEAKAFIAYVTTEGQRIRYETSG